MSICIYISVLSLCEAFQSHSRGRTAIHGLKPCALGPCSVVRTPLARLSMQGEEEIPLESVEDGIIGTYDRLWRELRGTCVFLVGMTGTGKSTSGDILARETGYGFIDTDEAVEFILEEPISSFLANPENEPQFRELEYKVASSVPFLHLSTILALHVLHVSISKACVLMTLFYIYGDPQAWAIAPQLFADFTARALKCNNRC